MAYTSDVNKASGSKAKATIFKIKTKAKTTNYCKRQHLLLKQSTALYYGNADAMINMSHCILKNI